MFANKYGPWAVVAGASEGMGAQFAKQLSARGLKVVLIARREQVLTELAATLPGESKCLPLDLALPDAAERIAEFTRELDVGLVVYNAALSPIGPFLEQSLAENLRAIDVNVKTPTAVAHHFAPRLVKRGRGGLVLLSSLTAFQGSPFVSTYGATKSFNLSLAEGLWAELREQGVDVLSVCAGATATPNLLKAVTKPPPGMQQPEEVVREALDALGDGPVLIPGRFNRFASFLLRRLLPRRSTIQIMANQTRKLQLPS
ncbi:MAG: SDR family NAD(P)-dependent oxidoreductase [Archangium sp.]|nr:SDR family NAD(P)-dependent oxidoreductase [Archangium sp.]MDP3152853.1 SDR family NAD(P)-dependent oxidoreductase [Archangium sp.]MDP3569554.1 SDR family NAD(P)-dependent oxidoreductase [Archangium sp.]